VPIKGGNAPTIAPIKVFADDFCFIGRYTHKYANQIPLETIHVYGSNMVYAANDAHVNPVPIKHPFFELIVPFGMGLFYVRVISASYLASTT
jgi:hypothetical protein